jgi:hypothetical protein
MSSCSKLLVSNWFGTKSLILQTLWNYVKHITHTQVFSAGFPDCIGWLLGLLLPLHVLLVRNTKIVSSGALINSFYSSMRCGEWARSTRGAVHLERVSFHSHHRCYCSDLRNYNAHKDRSHKNQARLHFNNDI